MFRFPIILLLLLAFLKGSGQDSIPIRDTIPKFHFGFVLGVNGSTIKVVETNVHHITGEWLDTLDKSNTVNLAGTYIGFIFQYDLSSHLSIRTTPGLNLMKYAINYSWKNGNQDLIYRNLVFFQLPIQLGITAHIKKNTFCFLPGINLTYNHSHDFSNEPVCFTAADLRFEFSRPVKKKIAGIEFGFNRSFKTYEIERGPKASYVAVTDHVKLGCFTVGFTLKF